MKLFVTGILGICCIAAATAAEVEYADGKVEVCEIVQVGDDHLTISIEEHKMKVQLKVPLKRIRRYRQGPEGEWTVVGDAGAVAAPPPEEAERPAAEEKPADPPKPAEPAAMSARYVGWRRDGSGTYPGTTPPRTWSLNQNHRWSTPIPRAKVHPDKEKCTSTSMASPIVVGDKVFVMSEPHHLICLDKLTGEVRWQQELTYALLGDRGAGRKEPGGQFCLECYGYTCPTPVSNGTHVYTSMGTGLVACHTVDGDFVWANLFDTEQKQRSGVSQAPAIAGSCLVTGGAAKDAFAGWDLKTGEHRWSIGRGGGSRGKGSFQTVTVDGKEYVLVSDGMVIDPELGQVVQEGLIEQRNYGPTPVVHDGICYAFDNMGQHFMAGRIAPGKPTEILWKVLPGEKPGVSRSPLYHQGTVFLPDKNELIAFNAKTGKETGRVKAGGGWSSPCLAGGLIYWQIGKRDSCEVLVIKPDPQPTEIARFDPGIQASNAPCLVFDGDRVYQRAADALHCFGK